MNIGIAGAGAIGSRIGYMLQKTNHCVTLIDPWREHINYIEKYGLKMDDSGKRLVIPFKSIHTDDIRSCQDMLSFDVIILTVKANQLEQMLEALQPVLTPTTYVLCLLNGIGYENLIESYTQRENIIIGTTMWAATMEGPGLIRLYGTGLIELEQPNIRNEGMVKKLVEALEEAKLNPVYSHNIKESIWRKTCLDGALNPLSALLECNLFTLGNTSEGMIKEIIREFVSVGEAEGFTLDEADIFKEAQTAFDIAGVGFHFPSMYQDLVVRNRRTEIDYLNAVICEKGRAYGIPTPFNDQMTQMIHAKELIRGARV